MASVVHATIVIERTYAAAPARVFAAWAEADTKRRWFACHDDFAVRRYELDFRVGGRERLDTGPPGGVVHRFDARYHEILADERLVYAYDMWLGDTLISISLATVSFAAAGRGTHMIFTEQGAFLDGHHPPEERRLGTEIGLDNLGRMFPR
jgi:uncharacterized protein YndB with AHSA1/START domain